MVTRKDIADKVGVSVSSVSRALNNSGYVQREKRKEILRVADELGYHPNPVAMSLQQRRTKQILYYSKDLNNYFNIELYQGMIEEADKNGYVVLINGRFNFELIPSLMIDGIILPNDYITSQYLEAIGKNYHLPVVTASYGEDDYFVKPVPIVQSDLYQGMKDALQYLWDSGHRKIAMISSYDFHLNHARTNAWISFMKYELEDRIEDYYFGISKEGLHNDQRVMKFLEERSSDTMNIWESYYEKGELAADIFHERQNDATAVIGFNDEMTLGFCKRIQELGYKIPEDLSLMGIDGIPAGEHNNPKLTTLEIQAREMGAKCVQILISILDGCKDKCIVYIPTRILGKDSVKKIKR